VAGDGEALPDVETFKQSLLKKLDVCTVRVKNLAGRIP
jgi:hypothetical protein